MWWIVGVVLVVALAATYLTWLASRVDRLHDRAASAQVALDAHLERRRIIAASLADTLGDAELAQAAAAAAKAAPEERDLAENDLSRALRALPYPPDSPVLAEIAVASRRVALARQVHNDLARDALAMRRRLLVRALRLDRRHPAPRYFDVDDPLLGPLPAAAGRAAVPVVEPPAGATGAAGGGPVAAGPVDGIGLPVVDTPAVAPDRPGTGGTGPVD